MPDGSYGYCAGTAWTHPQAMLAAGLPYYPLPGIQTLLRQRLQLELQRRTVPDRLRYRQTGACRKRR